MKSTKILFCLGILISCLLEKKVATANERPTAQDNADKIVRMSTDDHKLALEVNCTQGCKITALEVNGHNTLGSSGVFTSVRTSKEGLKSSEQTDAPSLVRSKEGLTVTGIAYGGINESWKFSVEANKIIWTINRTYAWNLTLEDIGMPVWNFSGLNTWKGGILDNGGMVWSKYLRDVDDTYGIHTGGVTFWNDGNGDALRISAKTGEKQFIASKYSHNAKGEFTCTRLVTDRELGQRYNLSRFVSGKADVFAPFNVEKGHTTVTYELEYVDYAAVYDRGHLPGIDAIAVRELLNTTARYGVVDNGITGGNGWVSNWKCLHEPFFAQIGLAVDDPQYTKNLSATLDQERDQAVLGDGRVLSRWHNAAGDEIPGTFNNKTGYYEAKWGYTIDSQTGYVINTAGQFDLNGDINWLRSHKSSCEKALEWLIKRDSNNNGIFEMINGNVAEQQASDWLDIVWAGFENAFVNAQMYEALNVWSACESVMGDTAKATVYAQVAARLKEAFNKPVEEGGFWSAAKQQYVYWRDKDGSIHGDNLVTPVNFAAIAFGICDDPHRKALILQQIERRTAAENLFHWPLCFDSFRREEVEDGNWPFPRYENGDIFPTWGYLGIRSYVGYDKDLAIKYIRNILSQYRKDGLSSQRYSRKDQSGQGSDILAGISTTVTALYSDVYGVRPKWNRMGVQPNMTAALNGTTFSYTLRDTVYTLTLNQNDYQIQAKGFSVKASGAFGIAGTPRMLIYYPDNKEEVKLLCAVDETERPALHVEEWALNRKSWSLRATGPYNFRITGLKPGERYALVANNNRRSLQVQPDGTLAIQGNFSGTTAFVLDLMKH